MPLIRDAVSRALGDAGLERTDHVIVSSPHARAAAAAAKRLGAAPGPDGLGYAGAADLGLRLAAVLDAAQPGDDDPDRERGRMDATRPCCGWPTGSRSARRGVPVAEQLEGGREVTYATYLIVARAAGTRAAAPPRSRAPGRAAVGAGRGVEVRVRGLAVHEVRASARAAAARVRRLRGGGRDGARARWRTSAGTVATYTVDRLAFSPSPPMIDAVVDFDGGGRYTLEVTDAAPEEVEIGTRLELTFRRLYTTGGVHNYFWKVRPI